MRATWFPNNGSIKSIQALETEIERLLADPANGGNRRRRKKRLSRNDENAGVTRPKPSTGAENQPRCGRSSTPVAPLRACHPADGANGGNGAWPTFFVAGSPPPNGGKGGATTFVTAGIGALGRAAYVAACCREGGKMPALAQSAGEAKANGAAPLSSCATPGEAGAANAHAERDARGRFVKGNKGGPGNPFNRRLAAMRKALCTAVTPNDIRDLAALLQARSREGDLAAMKLLFLYTIGRPTEPVNPDTLDQEEWSLVKQSPAQEEALELLRRVPPWFLCEFYRGLSPAMTQDRIRVLAELFRQEPPNEKAGRAKTARAKG